MRVRPAPLLASLAGLAMLGAAGTILVRSQWLAPAAELRASIAEARSSLSAQRQALREADAVAAELDAFAVRTLGTTREVVDHALRTRLGDLAETAGIPAATIATRGERVFGTPMRSAMPRRGIWDRLRDEPDLVELAASISGEADFPSVMRLMAGLAEAPWPRRIDGFRLDPRGGGERLGFRIDLTTGYLPDRGGDGPMPPAAESPAVREAVARLVARDPFRLPPPPPPPAPEPPPVVVAETPPDPGPPPFPWGRWLLTGVAEGPGGPEAWVRHRDEGTAAVLGLGDAFHLLRVESIDAEGVVLASDEDRVRIRVGESLAAARRLK